MAKHIGIVACSAEGAALCYQTICRHAAKLMGEHDHPEITMHTHPLSRYIGPIRRGDWEAVAQLMLDSANVCARGGAEFLICPDNTIHQALDMVRPASPLPWMHIADVVALKAELEGHGPGGGLGTKFLMEGPVYPDALARRNIERIGPEPPARDRINEIIFSQLVRGVFTDESREYFNSVIADLGACGATAVVLGCTEIPLLIGPDDAPMPTLDSTRLLAQAAVEEAVD